MHGYWNWKKSMSSSAVVLSGIFAGTGGFCGAGAWIGGAGAWTGTAARGGSGRTWTGGGDLRTGIISGDRRGGDGRFGAGTFCFDKEDGEGVSVAPSGRDCLGEGETGDTW
jgi:hypothetical protein